MEYDLLIKNGTIVDGTGQASFKGHVAVNQDRIVEVVDAREANADSMSAARTIDAQGLTVAPGFIDIHSHNDFIMPLPEQSELLASMLEQGVTTVVGGNCGFSPAPLARNTEFFDFLTEASTFIAGRPLDIKWESMAEFLNHVEEYGLTLNLAQLAGHGSMRCSLWGNDYSDKGDDLAQMEALLDEAFDAGAYGLSLGLGYEPGMFVSDHELVRLAERVKHHDRILTVHQKAMSCISPAYGLSLFGEPHNIRSLKEILDLAEQTGVRLQISHFIFVGKKTWPSYEESLALIEQARDRGVDVAFDAFPQMAGNTTIYVIYPDWFIKDIDKNFNSLAARMRLHLEWSIGFRMVGFGVDNAQLMWAGHPDYEHYNGMFFPEIGRAMGLSTRQAYIRISRESKGKATCLFHRYSGDEDNQEALHAVLKHPLCTFETDALVSAKGSANPGAYGTFPRVIQQCHKELKLFSLEDAIARMTGKSAERIGLKDRGLVKTGYAADLTLFDYDEIRDNTTVYETRERPDGIRHVFINGVEVVTQGRADPSVRAGKVLRRS
jgi:N-acyl-D-amino-acid deacylase